MDKIKLAVVDDQHLFLKGIVALIREFDQFEIVIEACNGKEFIAQLPGASPDLVLLDLQMPVMDGVETAAYLQKHHPGIKVLMLSMHHEEGVILHLLEKGARGFLLKNSPMAVVADAIQCVQENGYYFNDQVSREMIKSLLTEKKLVPGCSSAHLSAREMEILRLICHELTNKEIATKLFISTRTVDGHREKILKKILKKIKAKNVIGVVMYAVKNHLL